MRGPTDPTNPSFANPFPPLLALIHRVNYHQFTISSPVMTRAGELEDPDLDSPPPAGRITWAEEDEFRHSTDDLGPAPVAVVPLGPEPPSPAPAALPASLAPAAAPDLSDADEVAEEDIMVLEEEAEDFDSLLR